MWSGETDADGRYRIEDVSRIPEAIYLVGAEYGGTSYGQRIQAPEGEHLVAPDLSVYEASEVDPGIRFERSSIVLGRVDAASRTISVFEAHSIDNPTDRAFVPRADGPGGPRGLLVFGLPPGASELRAEIGLDSARLLQIDRGVASLAPLPPGRTEIAFRYRFPYSEASYRFERGIRYPVGAFRVLTPEDGPAVMSDQLMSQEEANIGGQRYRVLASGPLTPGQTLTTQLSGLPVPGGPLASVPPFAVAMAGTALGLAAVTAAAIRTRREPSPHNGLESADLADHLVDLELARTAGRLSGDEYKRLRKALRRGRETQA
jgi:hypothetical protein